MELSSTETLLVRVIADYPCGSDTSETLSVNLSSGENNNPTGLSDSYSIAQNSENNSLDVLKNDSDRDNDQLSITETNYQGQGTLTIANDGLSLNYTPGNDFLGTESFSYTVADENGGTDTVKVSITVDDDIIGGGSVNTFVLLLISLVASYRKSKVIKR